MKLANLLALSPAGARTEERPAASLSLAGLLQRRLAKQVTEYLALLLLVLVFWYLVPGTILTRIIVNPGRIAREASAYAVKADQDVKQSIALADVELEEPADELLPGFTMDLGLLIPLADPYTGRMVQAPASGRPRPAKPAGPVKPVKAAPPPPPRPSSVVTGIGANGGEAYAMISDGSATRLYRVGDNLAGWVVSSISPQGVIVVNDSNTFVLQWKGD